MHRDRAISSAVELSTLDRLSRRASAVNTGQPPQGLRARNAYCVLGESERARFEDVHYDVESGWQKEQRRWTRQAPASTHRMLTVLIISCGCAQEFRTASVSWPTMHSRL